MERKWYFGVFSWRRKWAGKLVGPGCFFPGPTRMQSPQFRRKLERKWGTKSSAWERPNYHVQHALSFCHFLLFWPHVFLSFCLFLLLFIPFGCSSVFSFLIRFGFFFPNQFYFSSAVLDFCTLFYFLYNEIHIHTQFFNKYIICYSFYFLLI